MFPAHVSQQNVKSTIHHMKYISYHQYILPIIYREMVHISINETYFLHDIYFARSNYVECGFRHWLRTQ